MKLTQAIVKPPSLTITFEWHCRVIFSPIVRQPFSKQLFTWKGSTAMWSGFDSEAKSCWSRFENGLIYLDSKYEIQKECENRRCDYISLSHFPLFLLFHNFRNNLATVTRAYFASRSPRYRFCSPEYQINYTCSGLQAIFSPTGKFYPSHGIPRISNRNNLVDWKATVLLIQTFRAAFSLPLPSFSEGRSYPLTERTSTDEFRLRNLVINWMLWTKRNICSSHIFRIKTNLHSIWVLQQSEINPYL